MSADPSAPTVPLGEDHRDIREAVRALCAGFPAAYWRAREDADEISRRVRAGTNGGGLPGGADP